MKIKLYTLPNFVTLGNLLCGCGAIVAALEGDFGWVFGLVCAAAVCDFLDGAVARWTGQFSEVGAQLDSLADVVSFGVAPAMAMLAAYQAVGDGFMAWSGAGVFVFAAAAALRLAKFNVDVSQTQEFRGLPTPAAALLVVGALAGSAGGAGLAGTSGLPQWAILAGAAGVAILMVCPLRMFSLKFKRFGWHENRVRYTFLATAAVLIAILGFWGVAAAVALYIAISAAREIKIAGCRKK